MRFPSWFAILFSATISVIPKIVYCQIPPGIFIWLSSETGITLSGNGVISWKDTRNGFDFVQSDPAHVPMLISNGIGLHPTVHFDGYQYLRGPAIFPVSKDYTFSAVITINDTTGYNNIFSGDHHAIWLAQNTYPAVVHSDHFLTMATSRVGIHSGPNIITVRYSEATQQAIIYVNGLFGDSLFVDSNHDSTISIGSYQQGYFLHGDIAEMILYKRECSELEREQFEQYFFTKYGLIRPPPLPLPDSTFSQLPQHLQLYPRTQNDSAIVTIKGIMQKSNFDSIYCLLLKNNILIRRFILPLNYKDGKAPFSFFSAIHAEPSEYSFTVGVISSSRDSVMVFRDSIVCGDVFLIDGQSIASFGYGDSNLNRTNEFCRTFGMSNSKNIRDTQWTYSTANYFGDAPSTVSGWGLRLQKSVLEMQKIPTCIINGSYSGTIIEYHLPDSLYRLNLRSIYGRMLYRTTKSNLASAAKALFWIQGELYSKVETYYSYFKELYNNWKRDYPGLKKIYLGQMRPSYCADFPISGLRDLQRTIEDSLSIIETFGLAGLPYHDGCHFHDSGWIALGDLVYNLVTHDFYNSTDSIGIHSPHIYKIYYSSDTHDEIKLVFKPIGGGLIMTSDTTVLGINAELKKYFYFDDSTTEINDLTISGDTLTMKLNTPSRAQRLTYLPEQNYNNSSIVYEGPWLTSSRGVGALIFWHFPINDWKNDANNSVKPVNLSFDAIPNPAQNSTVLKFNLPVASTITLSVFDVLGRELRTLLKGNESDGSHEVVFDASNLPAGEYFCRLQADDIIVTKKIVLTK